MLSIAHVSLGETEREIADLKQAFALRDKTSGWEKPRIEGMYYLDVTGEIHKAIDGFRSWESLEPNAFPPHNSLGVAYADIGSYEKAGDESRLAIAA